MIRGCSPRGCCSSSWCEGAPGLSPRQAVQAAVAALGRCTFLVVPVGAPLLLHGHAAPSRCTSQMPHSLPSAGLQQGASILLTGPHGSCLQLAQGLCGAGTSGEPQGHMVLKQLPVKGWRAMPVTVGRLPSGLCLQQARAGHCFPRGQPALALPAAQGSGRTPPPRPGSAGTCSSAADSGCFTPSPLAAACTGQWHRFSSEFYIKMY